MARDVKDELQFEGTQQPQGESLMQDSSQIIGILPFQRSATQVVLEDFRTAKRARDSREFGYTDKGEKLDFDKWLDELNRLYFGRRIPKSIPWRFCSNRSLMIGMAILEVMHARLFPAVYNEELLNWRPVTIPVDEQRAERVSKLMFWWLRVHSKVRDFFDQWVRIVIGYGDALVETNVDMQLIDKGETSQEQPMTDEMGNPAMNPDGTPQVIPSQKILDREVYTRSDIIPKKDVFLQPGATDIQKDPVIIRVTYFYRDLEQLESEGKVVNVSQPSVVGAKTLKDSLLVTGAVSEGLDDAQAEEIRNIKRRNMPVTCLKWYGNFDIDGDGHAENVRLIISQDYEIYLGGVEIKNVSKRSKRHLDLTMFMPRLDEPHNLWGLGVLEQVKELALEIDAIFNQMTDANTLSVLRPGFYDPSGDLDAAALNIAPNRLTPVTDPQRSIYFPDFKIPTEQLIISIRLVLEFIERLTAASSYIMGKESEIVGGSGTATRTTAIIQAANQRFSAPVQRLREGAARIVTQHLDLVQMNLPEGMEERVLGDAGEPLFGQNELSQESISGEFDAYLLPDESMGSKEHERQLADYLYQILLNNLIVMTDPAKLYKVTADVLKAYGKDPQIYLGPEPMVNMSKTPEEENQLMLQGDLSQVKATPLQNPIEHIMAHRNLVESPAFKMLPPVLQAQLITFIEAHIQEHIQLMQTMMMLMQRQKKGGMNAGGNGTAGRATGPTQGVSPESRMETPGSPLEAATGIQREGESRLPT